MKKIILAVVVALSLGSEASAQHRGGHSNRGAVGFQGYYNGYGVQPGFSHYNNGWNRLNYPVGGVWFRGGYLPYGYIPYNPYGYYGPALGYPGFNYPWGY